MTSNNEYQNMNKDYPTTQNKIPPLAYAPQQPQYVSNEYGPQPYISNAQHVHYLPNAGYGHVQAAESQSASVALCLFITGIFIPLIHLVNVCMHIGSSVPKKKMYAKLSLGFFILELIIAFIISNRNSSY